MSNEFGMNQRERAVPKPIKPPPRDPETGAVQTPPPAAAPQQAAPHDEIAIDMDALEAEHLAEMGEGYVRQVFAQRRLKLAAPQRPGFMRHWANNTPERFDEMRELGWKVVNEDKGPDKGKPIVKVVGRDARGDGQKQVLMEIPIRWYEENFKAREKVNDDVDQAIRRNEIAVNDRDGKRRYIPRDGIAVQAEALVPTRARPE